MIEWETHGHVTLCISWPPRFPEIRHSAKLPSAAAAAELKVTLQALAEMAGYGTSFAEVWPRSDAVGPHLSRVDGWNRHLGRPEVKDASG